MTPTEAAEIISTEYGAPIGRVALEAWIRSGTCPFGVHIKDNGANTRGKFQIFPTRLHAYLQAADFAKPKIRYVRNNNASL